MKKIIILYSLLIAFLNSAVAADEIVQLKIPQSGKAVMRFVFKNGSISDPKGKEGLTMLTTDMLTESGTKKLTSTDIRKMTYPWSARMGSFTDKEVSILTFEVPTKYLQQFYSNVVRDLILNPSLDKNDFDRLLSNQKNYVEEVIRQSSDEEYGKKYLESILFDGTPYSHLTAGTVASLSSITIDDVKQHYKNMFTRNNVLIGMAGDYPESMPEQVKKDMNLLPDTKPALPALNQPKTPNGLNVHIVSKPGALGSAISAGFPMNLTRANDEFAALMVANSWLGEHRKSYSRLYQKIREARSMNYGDYTYIEWYENGGSNMLPVAGTPRSLNYFSIWIRPVQTAKGLKGQYEELKDISVGHAHFALRMALKEMDEMINKGMSKEDFESTRDFLKSYSKLYIETPAKKLGFLMDSRFYGRTDWITELDGLLAKLTLQDVNNAIKKYWQTKNMEIVIITDDTEATPLAESLGTDKASPMSYSSSLKSSLPETILSEDNSVSNYPVRIREVKIISSAEPFKK